MKPFEHFHLRLYLYILGFLDSLKHRVGGIDVLREHVISVCTVADFLACDDSIFYASLRLVDPLNVYLFLRMIRLSFAKDKDEFRQMFVHVSTGQICEKT